MILVLVALPLAVALVVLFMRRLRLLSALLSAGALTILSAGLLAQRETSAWVFYGRIVSLPALDSAVLAYCFGLLALALFYSRWVPQGELDHPLTLSLAALCIGAAALRNAALATLLLEVVVLSSAMLIPSERPGAALGGMRALVLLALAGPLLLVATWAAEQFGAPGADEQLAQVAAISLTLGLGLGLGLVPWHIWQPAVYQHGRVLAAVALSVVLPAMLLLRLGSLLQTPTWPGLQAYVLSLLGVAGTLTAVAGGVMAVVQRSVGRTVSMAALADLGVALIGLGMGNGEGARSAFLHLAYRGMAATAAVLSVGVLQRVLGGDSLDHLRGAFRRTPLAMLGLVVGLLSLAGLPLTAGFGTRLTIYASLLAARPAWGMAVIASSLAVVWSVARICLAAWVSTPVIGEREPAGAGLIIALLCLALLAAGVWPNGVNALLGNWLSTTLGPLIWR